MKYLDVKPYPTGMQISRNHKLLDFVYDERAYDNRFYMQYVNQPAIVENIRFLCESLIDPLESRMGMTFEIISGYRCRGVDLLAGEPDTQLHLQGLAIDIRPFVGIYDLIDQIFHLPFHECYVFDQYIHMGVKPQFNQGRFIDFRKK